MFPDFLAGKSTEGRSGNFPKKVSLYRVYYLRVYTLDETLERVLGASFDKLRTGLSASVLSDPASIPGPF